MHEMCDFHVSSVGLINHNNYSDSMLHMHKVIISNDKLQFMGMLDLLAYW